MATYKTNLATTTLTGNINTSQTSIAVADGTIFPDVPFHATLMPVGGIANIKNSEIVKVTAVSGNTMTVSRAQLGTTARTFAQGSIFSHAIYANEAVFSDDDGEEEVNTAFITAKDIVKGAITDIIYPVGSIYMSATLTTPEAVTAQLGGTWQAWGAGRVPVGVDTTQTEFDTVEETGGEKAHKLTVNEMPSHAHNAQNYTSAGYATPNASGFYEMLCGGSVGGNVSGTQNTGGSQSHNNLQPYITCYMYKRIS